MWISFTSKVPFAIKVFVGGVNAISGDRTGNNDQTVMMRRLDLMEKKKSVQDYIVTPKQLWLDGIASDNECVRQFVAMPLDSGYSIEAQVTGQDLIGGLQFHVTPATPPYLPPKGPNPPGFDDSPIQIYICTLMGKMITLNPLPSDRIDEVKEHIEDIEGIPRDQQRLISGAKQLCEGGKEPSDSRKFRKLMSTGKSLADYGIKKVCSNSTWGLALTKCEIGIDD